MVQEFLLNSGAKNNTVEDRDDGIYKLMELLVGSEMIDRRVIWVTHSGVDSNCIKFREVNLARS